MEGKIFPLLIAVAVCFAGCAARSTADFDAFHTLTAELGVRSVEAMDAVSMLIQAAECEAIAEDPELLEGVVLHRSGPFSMEADSTGLAAAAVRGRNAMIQASMALNEYSMVLSLIADGSSNPIAGNHMIPGPAAIVILAGRNTLDRRQTVVVMRQAAPALDSLAVHGAEMLETAAAMVQVAYGDMMFRRQVAFQDAAGTEKVMEMFELNMLVTELQRELEMLHRVWLAVPGVNSELAEGLKKSSVPLSLSHFSGMLQGRSCLFD